MSFELGPSDIKL